MQKKHSRKVIIHLAKNINLVEFDFLHSDVCVWEREYYAQQLIKVQQEANIEL